MNVKIAVPAPSAVPKTWFGIEQFHCIRLSLKSPNNQENHVYRGSYTLRADGVWRPTKRASSLGAIGKEKKTTKTAFFLFCEFRCVLPPYLEQMKF